MAFHGRNKHLAAKKKLMSKSKRSDRTRAVAKHQAKVKAVLDAVMQAVTQQA